MTMKILMTLVLLILLGIPTANAVTFCDGSLLKENITVTGTVIEIETHLCPNGCTDNVTSTGAACNLTEWELSFTFWPMIIIIFIMIFFLPHILRRKKKNKGGGFF